MIKYFIKIKLDSIVFANSTLLNTTELFNTKKLF